MKFICPNNTSSLIDYILKNYIKNDMIIADMTLGNGYDSCNILSYLNGTGFLYALDIQDLAINKSMENLKKINYNNYKLIKDSHINFDKYIKEEIDLAIFNLGYLPGGDKSITTKSEDVLICIEKLLVKLKNNGLVLLTLYPGHKNGADEKEYLEKYFKILNQKNFNVLKYDFINQKNNPPYVIMIEKKGDK